MTETPPPEPRGGQDDEPPDVRLAVVVAVLLLRDLADLLDGDREDAADLRRRLGAVLTVLVRVRRHLEGPEE